MAARFSPAWVHQVFADRGHRSLTRESVSCYVGQLGDDEYAEFVDVLRRIQAGVDVATETAQLISRIRQSEAPVTSRSEASPSFKGGMGHSQGDESQRPPKEQSKPELKDDDAVDAYQQDLDERRSMREASVRVFAASAAITLEIDIARRKAGEPKVYCVTLDASSKTNGPAGIKHYDWKNKVQFQFGTKELPMLAAVLLGKLNSLTLNNHGADRDKYLSIVDQGESLFLTIRRTGFRVSMPISPPDVFHMGLLCLKVLQMNHPGLEGACILAMIERAGKMSAAGQKAVNSYPA